MNETEQKPKEKVPKLSRYEQTAIRLLKEDPALTNYGLGKKIKDMGLAKSDKAIYNRLKQKDYLRREFHEIRAANLEFLSREVTPVALKIHRKVLRDRTIENKDKKDWVAMALRAEFKPSDSPGQQTTINIAQMQVLQQLMRGNADKGE